MAKKTKVTVVVVGFIFLRGRENSRRKKADWKKGEEGETRAKKKERKKAKTQNQNQLKRPLKCKWALAEKIT